MSYIENALRAACDKVHAIDFFLIAKAVREETVSHRLAVYLEPFFPGFNVDCEYDKSEEGPKKIVVQPDFTCQNLLDKEKQDIVKKRWNEKADTQHGLRPDVIVHRRGLSQPIHNMLVVECKIGKPDKEAESWALLRLNEFTSGRQKFTYQYGALVVFRVDSQPSGTLFQYGSAPINWPQ